MPVPTTTQDLLDLVRKSELVPPARLEAFINQVNAASSAGSPRELSQLLIAAGLVTNFQAEQFLQGKWRGFTIGKYRVLERLGSGGMGTVYLCEHLMVGRKVAVKVLPTSQADNPSALGRFYREARAAGVLDHPNLVKAHDVDSDAGLHYLVMDYVDGTSLQELVARFGALSVPRACNYIRQAARGLQHAHASGLVHRDIKPANILLERNGTIRLLDLGLARFFNDNVDMLTLKYDDRNVLGTADYVSPEQALNSHDVDIRTDIYSLGATFYFMLTGQPPFPTGKVAQKLVWHQVRVPTPVHELKPHIPPEVSALIEVMMAKQPAGRFQTPVEVIEALEPFDLEVIDLPREEEMPQLSPAAAATVPGNPGPATMRRAAFEPRRPATAHGIPGSQTAAMPMISGGLPPSSQGLLPGSAQGVLMTAPGPRGSSNRMVSLGQQPPPGELATPRSLGTQVPTKTEQPRPAAAAPITPSKLFGEEDEEPLSPPPETWPLGQIAIVAAAAAAGFAGMAGVWWLLGQ